MRATHSRSCGDVVVGKEGFSIAVAMRARLATELGHSPWVVEKQYVDGETSMTKLVEWAAEQIEDHKLSWRSELAWADVLTEATVFDDGVAR